MIPNNLNWAFEDDRVVKTPFGTGSTRRRRLADLVLTSGVIATGLPGSGYDNETNEVQPSVPPGTYPVTISVIEAKDGTMRFAFLSLVFRDTAIAEWESAGTFFTDSGDGMIYDASLTRIFQDESTGTDDLVWNQWQEIKESALKNGDGNFVVQKETGANAIIFRTADWRYSCFVGRDDEAAIVALVVDGRIGNEADEENAHREESLEISTEPKFSKKPWWRFWR